MDVAALAKDVAAFLTPFLPYLLKAGERAAEEAAKKLGSSAWEKAKALWGKLWPTIKAKPAAQEAVQDVATSPQDEDAQAALRLQLKKILAKDNALAAEVARLWEEARASSVTATASGERSVAIGRHVASSTIVVGDQNVVQHGKYNVAIHDAKEITVGDRAQVQVDTETED